MDTSKTDKTVAAARKDKLLEVILSLFAPVKSQTKIQGPVCVVFVLGIGSCKSSLIFLLICLLLLNENCAPFIDFNGVTRQLAFPVEHSEAMNEAISPVDSIICNPFRNFYHNYSTIKPKWDRR